MGWLDKLRTPHSARDATPARATDALWSELVEAFLGTVLRDWQNPQPVDPRLIRDVTEHVLSGGGSIARLHQHLLARPHGYGVRVFTNTGHELVDGLCSALSVEELDRWERFTQVLTVVDAGRGGRTGAAGTDRWLSPLAALLQRAPTLPSSGMTVGFLMALAERFGDPGVAVVQHALRPAQYAWQPNPVGDTAARMPDWGAVLVRHRDLLAPQLTQGSVDDRVNALRFLAHVDPAELGAFVDELAAAATTTSAKVREAAQSLLARADRDPALAALRVVALKGKPDIRVQALSLVWQLADDRTAVRQDARAIAADDRAASVQALLAQWDAGDAVPDQDVWDLPEEAPIVWGTDPANARRLATHMVETLIHHTEEANQQALYRYESMQRSHPGAVGPKPTPRRAPDRREVDAVTATLASDAAPALQSHLLVDYQRVHFVAIDLAADPAVTPALLLTCLSELLRLGSPRAQVSVWEVFDTMHAERGAPSLLELQRLLDAGGLDGTEFLWRRYSRSYDGIARGWSDEAVWPFVATNLDLVLAEQRDSWDVDGSSMYRAVATLPATPARVVERLYDAALGGTKSDRLRAQEALGKRTDRAARAAAALGSGKAEARIIAAQWLTDLGDPAVVPDLLKAYAREKQDVVRGALLDALEAAGEDPAEHLSRERLITDAEGSLAKGLPKDLAWLAWDTLPVVRWADGGEVPRVLLQGLVAQAVRSKSPEPDAIVRRACAMFETADAELFAERLLAGWLAEDLRPAPGGPPDQPGGSATSTKGLLAVVGACGGQRVVAPSERYLREWYGMRASQGKALLAMLSWVDHPSATQLVLSVGSRFRTKAFQEEAVRLAAALADRKGWTLDELADRTIPTAGFVGDGVLPLPYGERVFTARLLPDLSVQLSDPDGKVVKALPQPRQSDDADLAKESKKTLSSARKELKGIARLQHDRLYEALCTGRGWTAADWQDHLASHPVIRHQVQRLVWVARPDATGEGEPVTFRLLEDATLTDVDDEPVELDREWRVELAHQTTLSAEAAAGWPEHLADYEVAPLFQQFGKQVYELPDDLRNKSAIVEFKGHVLEAFQLRGRALKLGWSRGPVEDAGWFHAYEKRFPSLGLVARLGFTGNGVPEENRTVALTELTFVQTHGDGQVQRSSTMMLRDVPTVLLSECRADLAALAALGPGHDPDWEKTTQW